MPTQRGYNQQNYMPNYFPSDYTSPQGMDQFYGNMEEAVYYGPNGELRPKYQQMQISAAPGEPVLSAPGTASNAPPPPSPVLAQPSPIPIVEGVPQAPMSPQESAIFTAANPQIYDDDTEVTASRRDGTQMGQANKGSGYQKIGLNERLIRLGGAMQGASHLGGNAAMGAFGQEYANMQNADREGLAAYQKAQMDHQTALAKAQGAGGESQETLMQYDMAIAEMDALYSDISSAGDSLTGLKDGTWGRFVDRMTGDPKAVTRMQMEQFKVDQILISIAKTKGAISDKEMAVFERPMPSISMDQEETWLAWIKERRDTTADIRNRLANGTTAPNAPRAVIPQDDDELFNY
jgi:hypothetical protein